MKNILILGAGKIGCLIATLLIEAKDYCVTIADQHWSSDAKNLLNDYSAELLSFQINCGDPQQISHIAKIAQPLAIVSCLPFYLNPAIAEFCAVQGIHYFDLTEDVQVTEKVKELSKNSKSTLIPQCGLAPGMIGIIAYNLIHEFEEAHSALLRVGALPQYSHNLLKYQLMWSTEGLINEYLHPCLVIEQGHIKKVPALSGYEQINLDGHLFEAFATSGGVGNLAEHVLTKVKNLNYKTLRYIGHHDKIQFLLHDLKFSENPTLLRDIFEKALPHTTEDVVHVYVSVNGYKNGIFTEKNYYHRIYPDIIHQRKWSAIQIATASGLCCVLDIFFEKHINKGFFHQEEISMPECLKNRFGKVFFQSINNE